MNVGLFLLVLMAVRGSGTAPTEPQRRSRPRVDAAGGVLLLYRDAMGSCFSG